MLQANLIQLSFGSRTLFDGLSWQLQKGDRVGLVGPNGAGKTTLLQLLAGETLPQGGSIFLGGGETVGYLPQEAPRAGNMTVLQRVLSGEPRLDALRQQLQAAQSALEADVGTDTATSVELCAALAEAQEAFAALGGYAQEAEAQEIVAGLGFAAGSQDAPLQSLSGGWWMRVELARLLLMRPSYLLLDEPTNHLDIPSRQWLEDFLRGYTGGWVVASHDRYFLNRMVTSIAELGPEGILAVPGSFEDYLEARAAMALQQARSELARAKKLAHMQAFIDRFRAKASKASQVQSRIKMMGREPGANRARQQAQLSGMNLPTAPRSGEMVLDLQQVGHGYGGHTIFSDLSWTLRRGDKVALVGPNGAGKSTLLKLAAQVLSPDRGRVNIGTQVVPYYFAQHQLEVLQPELTVLQQMQVLCKDASMGRLRSLLGAFLFSGDAVDKKVGVLSGGEKSKLVLAQMVSQPYNFLLLDEPTNHLDMASCEVLEAALSQFAGSIICISHDRAFIDAVADGIMHVQKGSRPHYYAGDYTYFLAKQATHAPAPAHTQPAAKPKPKAKAKAKATASGPPPASVAPLAHHGHRQLQRQNDREARQRAREVAQLEARIDALEKQLAAIDQALCDPQIFADPAQSQMLLRDRESQQSELEANLARWESLAAGAPAAT